MVSIVSQNVNTDWSGWLLLVKSDLIFLHLVLMYLP